MVPEGGSLYQATGEIGNTYVLDGAAKVHGCTDELTNCFIRTTGSFTVDESAITIPVRVAIVHLVFEDGRSGWMSYNAFVQAKPAQPVATRRVARLGMTSSEIRSNWGPPDSIATTSAGDIKWSYAQKGAFLFSDDKLGDMRLSFSLLAMP